MAKTLREINTFKRDDDTPLQYTLVNIKDWCKNDPGKLYIGSGTTAGVSMEATINMTFTGVFIGLFAIDATARFTSFSIVLNK